MKNFRAVLLAIGTIASLLSLRDTAVVTSVQDARPSSVQAYHSPQAVGSPPLAASPVASTSSFVRPRTQPVSSPVEVGAPIDMDATSQIIAANVDEIAVPSSLKPIVADAAAAPDTAGSTTPPAADAPGTTILYGMSGVTMTGDGTNTTKTTDTEDAGQTDTTGDTGTQSASSQGSVLITSLTPDSGIAGTNVIIQGAGFNSDSAKNTVTFGSSSSSSANYISGNQLRATVPQSIQSGFSKLSVNSDGVTSNSISFCVLRNSSSNVFTDDTQDILPGALSLSDSSIVRLGNPDNDNDLDMLVIDKFAGTVYLLVNNGEGIFTEGTASALPVIPDASSITDAVFGDLNKDGYPEILLTYSSGQSIRLLMNDAQGRFTDATGVNLPVVTGDAAGFDVGDANCDGASDVIIANKDTKDILLLNNGAGVFSRDSGFNLPGVIDGSSDIRFTDLNGDGDLDIITVNNEIVGASSLTNRVYVNNGQGQFVDNTANVLPEDSEYSEVLDCGDIDGDGDIDIIVANHDQNAVLVNNGSGVYTDQTVERIPTNDFISKDTKLGDVNGDGYPDIVLLGEDKMSLLLNDGEGFFEEGSIKLPDYKSTPALVGGKNVQIADINGDGALDIIVGGDALRVLVNSAANKPPVLDSIGDKSIEAGNSLTFNVAASDPNGDAIIYSVENNPAGSTFDAQAKLFSWVPGDSDQGEHKNIKFTAKEDTTEELQVSEDITITVGSVPVLTVAPTDRDITLQGGESVVFGASATDPGGNLPISIAWQVNDQLVSGTPDEISMLSLVFGTGDHTVAVTATNSRGVSSTFAWDVHVLSGVENHAPVIEVTSPPIGTVQINVQPGGTVQREFKVTSWSDPDLGQTGAIKWYKRAVGTAYQEITALNGSTGGFLGLTPGEHYIKVTVTDNGTPAMSASFEWHVTVTETGQAPTVENDTAITSSGAATDIAVLGNDNNLGANPAITIVNAPANGTADVNANNTIRYTPKAGFSGATDAFSYKVTNTIGASNTATVTVTVNAIALAPTANNDMTSTNAGMATEVAVLANDTNLGVDTVVWVVTAPINGIATVGDGNIVTYVPNTGFSGATDTFTYMVTNSVGPSNAATVTVTVNAIPQAPTAVNDIATTNAGTATDIAVLTNDTNISASPEVSIVDAPSNGTAVVNVNSTIRYTPNTGFSGAQDTFSYKVTSSAGASNTATVVVTVNAQQDAQEMLDEIISRSFNYFWNETGGESAPAGAPMAKSSFMPMNDTPTGLVRDRLLANGDPTTDAFYNKGSIAATGFGLAALCVAAEKYGSGPDWQMLPLDLAARAELILDTLLDIQSKQAAGGDATWGKSGLFYHFMKLDTGENWPNVEVSSIDTAILVAGALTAGEYFNSINANVNAKAKQLYANIDWNSFVDYTPGDHYGQFYKQWMPGGLGFNNGHWDYNDESVLLYMLAIGSPTPGYAVSPDLYYSARRELGSYGANGKAIVRTWFGSLFAYQYVNAFFDLRNMHDARNLDLWQNAVDATIANRQFCIDQAGLGNYGYNQNVWGLSSAYQVGATYIGEYGAPPMGSLVGPTHDGTVNPSVVASAIGMLPNEVGDTLAYMKSDPALWRQDAYGFVDSFKNSATRVYSDYFVGLDLGAALVMSANHADSGLVWNNFMNAETRYGTMGDLLTQLNFRPNSDPKIYLDVDDITPKSQFAYGLIDSGKPVSQISFNLPELVPNSTYLLAIHKFMNDFTGDYQVTVNANLNGIAEGAATFSHVAGQQDDIEYIEIDSQFLQVGENIVTLTWQSGGSWLAWKNIEISAPVVNNEWMIIRSVDGSEYRIDDTYYAGHFSKYGALAYKTFEQALNRVTEPYTDILFYMDDLSRDRKLTLAPLASDGIVYVNVTVNGQASADDVALDASAPKQVIVPAADLRTGWNSVRLVAKDQGGEWIIWNSVKLELGDPAGVDAPQIFVGASFGKTTVKLIWDSVSSATMYNLYRSTTTGGPYTLVDEISAPDTFYVDTGLLDNLTYYYIIKAVNANNAESEGSQEVAVTTGSYQLDYAGAHVPNVFGGDTFDNAGEAMGVNAFADTTRHDGLPGKTRVAILAPSQKISIDLNDANINEATIFSFKVKGVSGGEKFSIKLVDGAGNSASISITNNLANIWQEENLFLADTFNGVNLADVKTLELTSETLGVPVTLYFDEINFGTVALVGDRINATLRNGADDAIATSLDFGRATSEASLVLSRQYIELEYASSGSWGVQIYTDNKASDASPRYTGSGTRANGLIGMTDSGYRVPMLWQVWQAKKGYYNGSETPEFDTTVDDADRAEFAFIVDRSDSDWAVPYARNYRTPINHDADMGAPVPLANPGPGYWPRKGNISQPVYIYLAADFTGAAAQRYTTNKLTIDIYHE